MRLCLEYTSVVRNPHTVSNIDIEAVQKRAARWICARWNPSSYFFTDETNLTLIIYMSLTSLLLLAVTTITSLTTFVVCSMKETYKYFQLSTFDTQSHDPMNYVFNQFHQLQIPFIILFCKFCVFVESPYDILSIVTM